MRPYTKNSCKRHLIDPKIHVTSMVIVYTSLTKQQRIYIVLYLLEKHDRMHKSVKFGSYRVPGRTAKRARCARCSAG